MKLKIPKTKIKRPRITEKVRETISALFQQGLSASEIYNLRKKNGLKAPGLRSIQKIVSEAHEVANTPAFQKLEQPWHLGTLEDCPISAEAIANIFELKAKGLPYLTVRTAQWISKLSSLPLSVDVLYVFGWIAAYEEKTFDLANLPRDTNILTFETRLLAILQNPDKAHWTASKWEQPLSEALQYRQRTQEVLLTFYPIYIPPTLEELKGTPEYETWQKEFYSKENQKILKQIHKQVWNNRG